MRRLGKAGTVWGFISAIIIGTADPTLENQTLGIAIVLSGLYTLALYATRRWWLPLLTGKPVRNAMLLGIFNAAVIETLRAPTFRASG